MTRNQKLCSVYLFIVVWKNTKIILIADFGNNNLLYFDFN